MDKIDPFDAAFNRASGKSPNNSDPFDAIYAKISKAGVKQPAAEPQAPPNVTDDMSGLDTFRAGVGKFYIDTGRGIGQMARQGIEAISPPTKNLSDLVTGGRGKSFADALGLPTQADIDEARQRDKDLTNTTGGMLGNITGGMSLAAPAMLIPGANTVLGAGLTSAAMSGVQPVATGESRLRNTAEGFGLGAGGQIAGTLVSRGLSAAKAAGEPLYKGGQDAIMGRLLNKTAGGDPMALTNLRNATELVPGSKPTVGQAANNPGIAALERTVTQTDPLVAFELTKRIEAQNAARQAALGNFADSSKREFFDQSRNQAAKQLYSQAFEQMPQDSAWIKGQFTQLMKRPAFVEALKDAQTLAANEGLKLDPKNQTQIAHYAKMALDDQIKNATGNARRALMDTKDKLLTVVESDKFAPAYGEARKTFQAMSQPVNEIDTALAIQKAATDFRGNLTPSTFSRALQDKTAAGATGWRGATLENTLSPEAMQTMQAIKQDLLRTDFANTAGKGGSDTVQKMAYSNMVDAAGIPNWLRSMSVPQIPGNLLGRGADVVYGNANKEMGQRLAQAMLDPKEAARLMSLPEVRNNPQLMMGLANRLGLLGASSGPMLNQGLLSYSGQQ